MTDKHRRTNEQNYNPRDRASIAASRGKKLAGFLTWSGAVIGDAKAAVGDKSIADELQIQSVAVWTNCRVDRSTAVFVDQRRCGEAAIPENDPQIVN